jgi:hypothetical protein
MTASRSTRGRPPEASSNGQWRSRSHWIWFFLRWYPVNSMSSVSDRKRRLGNIRARWRASLSFDRLEQTAHLGSQQVNHNMGSLAAKDSTPRAPSFLSGEVARFMNAPSAQ